MKAPVQRGFVIIYKRDLAVEITCLGSLPTTEPTARNLWRILPHQIFVQDIKCAKYCHNSLFLQGFTSWGSSSSSSASLTPLIISCISGSSIFIFILPTSCVLLLLQGWRFCAKDLQRSKRIEGCACVRPEQRVSCIYSTAPADGRKLGKIGRIARMKLVQHEINFDQQLTWNLGWHRKQCYFETFLLDGRIASMFKQMSLLNVVI